MSNILSLNQSFNSVGLTSYTYTIAAAGVYNLRFSVTVPSALATGSGAGSGQGLGSGAGGGTLSGFAVGGGGPGHGAVGQGFGPDLAGYPQPPIAGSNQTSGPAVASSLVVTVTQNGSTIYTSPALSPTQDQLEFKISFLAAAADAMVINLTSANPADNLLNSVISVASIGNGI